MAGLGRRRAAIAWERSLRPGALFIVGDPKQSIYRFRRADIEIYNRVRERIAECGDAGDVLSLNANFRSHAPICDFVNAVSLHQFPNEPDDHNPRFEPLVPADPAREPTGECAVRVLTVPSRRERGGHAVRGGSALPATSRRHVAMARAFATSSC